MARSPPESAGEPSLPQFNFYLHAFCPRFFGDPNRKIHGLPDSAGPPGTARRPVGDNAEQRRYKEHVT